MKRRIVIDIEETNGEFKATISPASDDELLEEEIVAAMDVLGELHNQVSDTHHVMGVDRLPY